MRPLGLIPFWWGPVTAVVATVTLAIAGVTGGGGLLWTVLIGVAAVFLVVHSFVSRMLEQSIIRRLGRDYDKVQQRVVRVVADLGDLTGMYDLWMIDLYLPANRYRLTMRFPFIVRTEVLDRQLSVSLVDARPQPPSVDSMVGPHGEAYRSGAPVLWADVSQEGANGDNCKFKYETNENERLQSAYGLLYVVPIVDQLRKGCVGVLAVHIGCEPDRVVKGFGAVDSRQGRRRLSDAGVDLNSLIGR